MTPPRTNGLEQLQRALDELRRSLDAGSIDQDRPSNPKASQVELWDTTGCMNCGAQG